jgi:hypothetical protein
MPLYLCSCNVNGVSESCPVMCVLQFFAQAGFPCPPLRNPSDHFLRCINADFDKVKATLKGSMKMRVSFRVQPDPSYLQVVHGCAIAYMCLD